MSFALRNREDHNDGRGCSLRISPFHSPVETNFLDAKGPGLQSITLRQTAPLNDSIVPRKRKITPGSIFYCSSRLQTSMKHDMNASPAEILFAVSLHLLGEWFLGVENDSESKILLSKICLHLTKIRPIATTRRNKQTPFVPTELKPCLYVFVRVGFV